MSLVVAEEAPLDVGPWDGVFGSPLEVDGGAVSAPLEVACALTVWDWERRRHGVSIARSILGGT